MERFAAALERAMDRMDRWEEKEKKKEEKTEEECGKVNNKEVEGTEKDEGRVGAEGLTPPPAVRHGWDAGATGGSEKNEEKNEEKTEEKEKEEEDGAAEDWKWERERKVRESRRRNITIKGLEMIEGAIPKEEVEEWLGSLARRRVWTEWVEEKSGSQGGKFLIAKLTKDEDAREILNRKKEIMFRDGVEVDKDLTFMERSNRWIIRDKIREERKAGKKVTEEGEGKLMITERGSGEEVDEVSR